ncbi:hypothetical protein LIA77_04421 [Sarocladium implicatum]|nr:hypothetical protein LIA77_04421 [Sarocladium implicatum]
MALDGMTPLRCYAQEDDSDTRDTMMGQRGPQRRSWRATKLDSSGDEVTRCEQESSERVVWYSLQRRPFVGSAGAGMKPVHGASTFAEARPSVDFQWTTGGRPSPATDPLDPGARFPHLPQRPPSSRPITLPALCWAPSS